MKRANQFIELYKKLENTVRDTYGLEDWDSISYYLSNDTEYRMHRNEISYCQRVRNLLQHNEKIDGDFPVEPSEAMIEFITKLIEDIKNRAISNDIAVKSKDVYFRTMDDDVSHTMKVMRQNNFTHVPILEDGKVIGVFDENSIFSYLAEHEIISVEGVQFKHLEKYLDFDDREHVAFSFVKPDTYVDDLYSLFKNKLNEGVRLGMIFITPNGKETEQITGIITPWDILGKRDKR